MGPGTSYKGTTLRPLVEVRQDRATLRIQTPPPGTRWVTEVTDGASERVVVLVPDVHNNFAVRPEGRSVLHSLGEEVGHLLVS